MRLKSIATGVAVVAVATVALYVEAGPYVARKMREAPSAAKHVAAAKDEVLAPAVSVARVGPAPFIETVLVTGSLVPRDEVLVAPEIEGLRVQSLAVEEGARVKKGDLLATLTQETLEAQVAQNDAALARARAAIAKARSVVAQSEAKSAEAAASLERARPLKKSGYLAESTFDQREAAAKSAAAQVVADRDAMKASEAELAQVEAQRREIDWRRARTEVRAPVDGIVSRRAARIGAIATGLGDAMFRIIARGEIELDAEVTDVRLPEVRVGQKVTVEVAGVGRIAGSVRLVSPEVDKATRLGRVRILLGDNPALHIGAFARGQIETARSDGLAVPASAVQHGGDGATVLVVRGDKVESRRVVPGLAADGLTEIKGGLAEGELVVAKAGTFLREGDLVRPVSPESKVSGAAQ